MPTPITQLHDEFSGLSGAALSARLGGVAKLLGMRTLELDSVTQSPADEDSFRLCGTLPYQGGAFDTVVTVSGSKDGGVFEFQAKRVFDNGVPLTDMYDIPGARTADTFYGVRDNKWFDGVLAVKQAVFTNTTTGRCGIELTLVFKENSPIIERYSALMPKPDTPILFTGETETPLTADGKVLLSLRGIYPIEDTLPLATLTPMREAALIIDNNVFDTMDTGNYPYDGTKPFIAMTNVYWSGHVDLGYDGLRDIWLTFNIFDHAQRFDIGVDFGGTGLSVSNVAGLLAKLSGLDGMPELPDWLILNDVALYDAAFRLQKDISAVETWSATNEGGLLDGMAATFGLKLPQIPLPFFDTESGAKVTLRLQWDIISLGGSLFAVIGFQSSWKNYKLTFNLSIPHWSIRGRLFKEHNIEMLAVRGNGVFPGFLGLSIKDVSVYGDFLEESYNVGIALENETGISFPFIGKAFAITSAEGSFSYSTLGVDISLSLGFALFGANFYISGLYNSEGEKTRITLGGGLAKPLKLSVLLKEILNVTLPDTLELEISMLRLNYTALLGDNSSLSDSKERRFIFMCAVRFHWDILPDTSLNIESSFLLDWQQSGEKTETHLTIAGSFELMKFKVAASGELSVESMSFESFKFLLSLGDMSFDAKKVTGSKAVTIDLKNFNLGELLEALIGVIARDTNWYLPWPFKVLKQLTLKSISITFDSEKGTIKAKYSPKLKILFFTLESITVNYDRNGEESFTLDLELSGLPALLSGGEWDTLAGADGFFPLDLLTNNFPAFSFLGKPFFELKYLGVGQHIRVELPSVVSGSTIPEVLTKLKSQVKKDDVPTLDSGNNWLVGLDVCLLKSINISMLMCDPNFYGVRIGVTSGSDVTKAFAGLELVILYRKVSESIGVFQAHLALPEKYRQLELGAASIRLGEIDISIYTNGNFLIDLGFPHNKNFSRSFGLSFGIFSGQGGVYFGILNGKTSQNVPAVKAGSFGTVIELGLGVSVGVGREFRAGPLSGGAYVRLLGIFEGVFSSFTPPNETNSFAFYRIQATVGISARVYGEVDFVVISAGFSVELNVYASLMLESYRAGKLDLSVELKVSAYVKIFFIKINFSFSFTWKDSITLGKDELWKAPWAPYLVSPDYNALKTAPRNFTVSWYDKAVLDAVRELQAEVVPYFSFDGMSADGRGGQNKIGWLVCLQGYQDNTLDYIACASNALDTPLPLLIRACLRRLFISYELTSEIDINTLTELQDSFAENGHEGFSIEHLEAFFTENVVFRLIDSSNAGFYGEIHGIPMPCPPPLVLQWETGDNVQRFDLGIDPPVPIDFSARIREYFEDMKPVALNNTRTARYAESSAKNQLLSASTVLFCDYFYMLTKVSLSQALVELERSEKTEMDVEVLIDLVITNAADAVSGQFSRFLMGGLRVPSENTELPVSLYEFAHQQFNGAIPKPEPDAVAHRLTITVAPHCDWVALGHRMVERNALTGKKHLDSFSPKETLVIELKNSDLAYPCGTLPTLSPLLLPLHIWKDALIETKPLVTLDTEELMYEVEGYLPSAPYQVVYYQSGGKARLLTVYAVYAVRVPLEYMQEKTYSVGHIDRRSMEILQHMRNTSIVNLKIFRSPNIIDCSDGSVSEEIELVSVNSEEAFIYRSNLCLEAEKPEAMLFAENVPANSAYAEIHPKQFVSLLADACLVNSRGYVLRCEFPEHAAEDGGITLTILVQTDKKNGNAVIVPNDFDSSQYKPVIRDGKRIAEPCLPQGQVAVCLVTPEPEDDNPLGQNFNLLTFSMRESQSFRSSNESLPVFPRQTADEANTNTRRYEQILPIDRFIDGDQSDPYRGFKENLSFTLDFAALDILGNRTTNLTSLTGGYGYHDRLISPAAYPQTQCSYSVDGENGKVKISISFMFVEDNSLEGIPSNGADLETAYHQLRQSDVMLEIRAFGQWYKIDKQPLVEYLNKVRVLNMSRKYDSETKSTTTVLSVLTQTPTDIYLEKIDTALRITRSDSLLAPSLQGKPEGELVRAVSCDVLFNDKCETKLNLAKDAKGGVFLLHKIEQSLSNVSYWAVPPLSTNLLNLTDVPVKDINGNDTSASFADIDPEIWMDGFLRDVEAAIAPDSPLANSPKYQQHLENLLNSKSDLAGSLSGFVTHITHRGSAAAKKTAENAYCHAMLRNLYLGRSIDTLAVLQSGAIPKIESTAYIGQVTADKDVEISAGKITTDGLLAVAIRACEITAQKKLDLDLTYIFTDWEIHSNDGYSYLSLLNPNKCKTSLNVPLPYKRYPNKPELQSHSGTAAYRPAESFLQSESIAPESLFAWNYQVFLSHKTAAQDTVTIETCRGGEARARSMLNALWNALARYMFLRQEFFSDLAKHAGSFTSAVREVAAALNSRRDAQVVSTPLERVTFELDRAGGHISILENTARQVPGFALLQADGIYEDLVFDERQAAYILPKNIPDVLLHYRITFKKYQIAFENLMNVNAAVRRNENISGINSEFVYQTPCCSFPSPIKPSLKLNTPVECGEWEKNNFIMQIGRLWEHFGTMNIEIVYNRQMTSNLYALLPVLYAPNIASGMTETLSHLYTEAEAWRLEHAASAQGGIMQCNISFFSAEDAEYNLAELSNLKFYCQN